MIRIGTSGYTYSWNKGKPTPFQWYINQRFNSVEINASFYRFPAENWTKIWQAYAPQHFTFSIKVHRSITHYTRLSGTKSLELWERFSKTLKLIEDKIEFWLFQMPPNYKYNVENFERVRVFFEKLNLENKAVLEFRDTSWWKEVKKIADIGIVFCSVDAPGLPSDILNANNAVYLRLHGSKQWYNYVYPKRKLDDILLKMRNMKASKQAIYLNNDHGMLKNGLYLLQNI